MLTATLLAKKRDGQALSDDEIRFLIDGFCSGEVADYQMSALAMAICLRGMDAREIATLTRSMLESGDRLPRDTGSERPRVDKHSTGGLGDKVSLILAPLLAACDVDVPMISGRGLGLTGGTLDKLESIPGFQTQLSDARTSEILCDVGTFIVGASERVAPADRRLYALRDVTGTVESIPLITASILSKKLAASLDALVMDVKVGSGAFMKSLDQASELAKSIVNVGTQAGLPTTAILSDMDQPLGLTLGNAMEVNESVDVLKGGGPSDVRDLTVELCANLLLQVGICDDRPAAIAKLESAIDRGDAFERFQRMVYAQGGKLDGPLPLAKSRTVNANASGFVARFDSIALGQAVVSMGGGRRRTDDKIDPAVGIRLHVKVGQRVEADQPWMTVHGHDQSIDLSDAIEISEHPVQPNPLILRRE